MQDDKLTRLAFSVYSNKGIYALLLGSGISRAAGIPTAWEITTDLVGKFSVEAKENPQEWFENTFNKELTYSNVLESIVGTSEERKNVLRRYFETTNSNETIVPSLAHKSIAKLVKGGYIKVIITTNFDRLLEKALEDVGVFPQIIKSADDISGATPLVHSDITILKINGDYLDGRFKNTLSELEKYPEEFTNYLSRILEDYGLISCGWSGAWDKGLIQIIRSVINHRYNNFFTYVNKCEDELNELASFRKGETISIESADKFFYELSERVEALAKSENAIPASRDIVIARVKKYLSRSEHFIEYTDIVEAETNRVKDILLSHANIDASQPNPELFYEKWNSYGALDTLIPLYITCIRYGKEEHFEVIHNSFKRIVNIGFVPQSSFTEFTLWACYLPILQLCYCLGIACVFYNKYSLLNKILSLEMQSCSYTNYHKGTMIHYVNLWHFDQQIINHILAKRYKTPMSTLLYGYLHNYFSDIDGENSYTERFCIFEYLLSLYYNLTDTIDSNSGSSPIGEFFWRFNREDYPIKRYYEGFIEQVDAQKKLHEIFIQGMFNGSYDVFDETRNRVNKFLSEVHLY